MSASTSSNEGSPRAVSPAPEEKAMACNPGKLDEEDAGLSGEQLEQATGDVRKAPDDGIDRLLSRHRNELLFELRRLQHGDRPVTGQDNKRNVEEFFNRATQDPSSSDIERPRPQSVIVEVNALVQRRPVSSALQSAGFRRSLENSLRGAIGRVESSRNGQPQARQRRSQPVPAPRRTQVEALVAGQENLSTSIPPSQPRESPAAPAVPPPPVPPPPMPASPQIPLVPAPESPARAAEWVSQQPLEVVDVGMWEENHREDFIMEVSELIQRQLVTSNLASDFRNRLEGLLEGHISMSGADGARVQEFVQSIPRHNFHQRNDFTGLGIPTPAAGVASLSDDVSVISAAAAVSVPYAQSNAALNHEVRSLKTQIQELKNMMRMSFDLQLEMQRSIKQEVAAAMAGQSGVTASQPPQPSRPASEGNCLICLDSSVDAVLYQCGHMCLCYSCGLQLKARGSNCPVCRSPIRDIIRTFRSN